MHLKKTSRDLNWLQNHLDDQHNKGGHCTRLTRYDVSVGLIGAIPTAAMIHLCCLAAQGCTIASMLRFRLSVTDLDCEEMVSSGDTGGVVCTSAAKRPVKRFSK